MTHKDPPIELLTSDSNVIDIGDVRVSRGFSRSPNKFCVHRRLNYDTQERRVWCQDCERTIEGFDAFLAVARQCEVFASAMERREEMLREAETRQLTRRASRVMDDAWRKTSLAPACPHCKEAILPEDVAGGVSLVGSDIARQRRGRKGQQPDPA